MGTFLCSLQSGIIRVINPNDLYFLPLFLSMSLPISFVFGIKPDVSIESQVCKLHSDTQFIGVFSFFLSHGTVGRKMLCKISNMPLFDLDQILIESVPFRSVVISEVICMATHL